MFVKHGDGQILHIHKAEDPELTDEQKKSIEELSEKCKESLDENSKDSTGR